MMRIYLNQLYSCHGTKYIEKKIQWVQKEECCCLDKHLWNKGTDKHLT